MANFKKLISDMTDKKYLFLLCLLGIVVFLGALEIRPLEGGDETLVAGIGAEIALEGNWIVPKLNGKEFLEYPPFYYWLEALFFKIFGICDFAAKLPAAIGGFLMLFSVFGIARKFRESAFTSFFCAVMLLFSAQFFEKSRCCMVDALLAGFVSLSVWSFVECVFSEKIQRKLLFFGLFSVSCGLGIFTKGLLGIILPCAMLGSWILAEDFLQKKIPYRKYFLLAAGALCSLIIPCAWLFFLYREGGYSAVYEVVVTNSLERFTGNQGDHVVSYFYYLKKLPGQFEPWTILLPFALFYHGRNLVREKKEFSLFTLCALLAPYILLTVSASKRQVYLLPLYPMEALLIGSMAAKLFSGEIVLPFAIPQKVLKILPYLYALFLIVVGCVFLGFMYTHIQGHEHVKSHAFLYPVLTILGGVFLAFQAQKKNLARGLLFFLFGTAFLFASIDVGPNYNLDRDKAFFLFFEDVKEELQRSPGRVVLKERSAERLRGACVYYLGQTAPEVSKPQKGDLQLLIEKRKLIMNRIE